MSVHVGIPSIGCSDRLVPLVTGILTETDASVTVYCNRPGQTGWDRLMKLLMQVPRELTRLDRFALKCRYSKGIYGIWNLAMDDAEALGAIAVILNDDVKIRPGSLAHAESVFTHTHSDYATPGIVGWDPDRPLSDDFLALQDVVGTYRQHGVTGFAFAVNPALGVRCDERFGWWGGDDDLVWSFLKLGFGAYRMVGVGVDHPAAGGTSSRQHPEVLESVEADEALLFKKWKRSWAR